MAPFSNITLGAILESFGGRSVQSTDVDPPATAADEVETLECPHHL